jgi:PilZ domain
MDRLTEDDIVVLTLPPDSGRFSRSSFECHVLAIAGRTAALEAIDRSAVLRVKSVVENVFMTFTDGSALVGLRGMLVSADPPGDFRFVVSEQEAAARARPTRVDLELPLTIRQAGSLKQAEGVTVNVSIGGLLVNTDLEAAIGDVVGITLRLDGDDGDPLPEMEATVVRAASGKVAVQFAASVDRAVVRRIGSLVIATRRAERTRAQRASQMGAADF